MTVLLTVEDLERCAVGRVVADCDDDVWLKKPDGSWTVWNEDIVAWSDSSVGAGYIKKLYSPIRFATRKDMPHDSLSDLGLDAFDNLVSISVNDALFVKELLTQLIYDYTPDGHSEALDVLSRLREAVERAGLDAG